MATYLGFSSRSNTLRGNEPNLEAVTVDRQMFVFGHGVFPPFAPGGHVPRHPTCTVAKGQSIKSPSVQSARRTGKTRL
jgi:hypothetical protein